MAEDKIRNQPTVNFSDSPTAASEYYSNHVQMFWSGVDVTLVFGKLLHSQESIDKNIINIENRAKVSMPWSVAKLVATTLAAAVNKYEAENGELKFPGEYKIPVVP